MGEKRSMVETIVRKKKNWIEHNNERGWADERSCGTENGGKEGTIEVETKYKLQHNEAKLKQ